MPKTSGRESSVKLHSLAQVMATAILLSSLGCGKSDPPKPPPPEVVVVQVEQKDVPIGKEWIGTLDGLVNAQIKPQVTGYLLRQTYQEGSFVKKGQLLFEIDPRTFQAALDEAKGNLANAEGQVATTQANQVKAQQPVTRVGDANDLEMLERACNGGRASERRQRSSTPLFWRCCGKHFGARAAWHVPAGSTSAKSGKWVPGPGADFFNVVKKELGGLPFIAEDLGIITPDVSKLRDDFDIPGTRVLQFAFDGQPDNPYLPENFVPNTVVYTGTHDNPTSREWYEALPAVQRENLWRYLKSPQLQSSAVAWELLRVAWSSVAAIAIAPLQDLLNLGAEARMNVPGRAAGNWRWRCTEEMLSAESFYSLRELTRSSKRIGMPQIH